MGDTFTIFIEIDAVLKNINEENYDSYNQLFLDMLSEINRIKRKTIFILRDKQNKQYIKNYFHEDIFDYFEIISLEDLEKIKKIIKEKKLDVRYAFAILSCQDTIQAFRQEGIFTAYLKMSNEVLSDKKALEIVDYQKEAFTSLFKINYENLIFECNRFNDSSQEDDNEIDI